MDWLKVFFELLKALLAVFKIIFEKMANRMVHRSRKPLGIEDRLKWAAELRAEFEKKKSGDPTFDPVRFEILGEAVFSAHISGHVLAEILGRSPSPDIDVEAYLRGESVIATRLVDDQIALKYDPPSDSVEFVAFLLSMMMSVIFIGTASFIIVKSHLWWRGAILGGLGILCFLAAFSLIRSQQCRVIAQRLIKNLFPLSAEKKALLEERNRREKWNTLKLIGWCVGGGVIIGFASSIRTWKGALVLGGIVLIGIVWQVMLARTRIKNAIQGFMNAWIQPVDTPQE